MASDEPRFRRFLDNRGQATFATIGMPSSVWRDIYHQLLDARWRTFFAIALVLYLGAHFVFATLYTLEPGSITNADSFSDAYFFSVQTMMTIGYGGMTPATPWANLIVTIEAFLGLVTTAVLTGLVFAKFSRPSSNVLWSDVACISVYEGVPTLSIRMANARGNRIVQATLTVVAGMTLTTREGERFRKLRDLSLTRSSSPLFSVSWTAMHPIDEKSPLYGETAESLATKGLELICVVVGLDETSSQSVHSRHSYTAEELRWDQRFVDIIDIQPDGTRVIDYRRFHETQPARH
jgi:inward rectifier potassium channel